MKTLLIAMWAMLLLTGTAKGAEITLPDDLALAAPDAARLLDEKEDGFGLAKGIADLWRRSVGEVKKELFSGVKSVAAIMVGVILLGVTQSAVGNGNDMVSRYTTTAGALWITAVSAGSVDGLIGLGRDTIGRVSGFSKLLLPTLAAATAASGGITAASVRQTAAVFVSDLLLTVIDSLLLPMVYLYIGVAAAGAVLEGDTMDGIGKLLRRIIVWGLSGLVTLYTTYLTISGAVAGAVDAHAVRTAKAAVSGVVPVVGRILADAAESVLAGAGILRGMLGAFGALAVVGICLTPFLRLLLQYLLYQGAGLVCTLAGPKKLTTLLACLGEAFGLVLAMTASSALMLIISPVSMMTAVTT